ncbi:MAG TPA: N-acetylmuramoyl-L-alanine amidase [Candidatus Polarisedimenticolia bacterium]|jgi:N-acetylmuramoyl-L-alanine amidase|nr:N-acetylmuramoyl-L-alanine amidase [Candidatus Polarisedimenticolia bacterium]
MTRRALFAFLAILVAATRPAPSAEGPAGPVSSFQLPEHLRTFEVSPEIRILLSEENALFLEVRRHPEETPESVARGVMRDPSRWEEVRAFNPSVAGQPGKNYVLVPYEELRDSYKYLTIARLFPEDRLQGDFWLHPVGRGKIPVAAESLWHLALWLTGDGKNFQTLAQMNKLRDLTPVAGQVIQIHKSLLLPAFAAPLPTAEGDLTFGRDEAGEYGAYRLRKGEAIYSSVVVRFTGLLDPDDVNQMATLVAKRSGIEDVHSLAVGYEVKIPRENILPEFLPAGDLRRIEYELSRREVERFKNQAVSRDLEGVTVILDAGHGGRDIGASHNGVWESDYVYDVMCRIKDRLSKLTGAQVLTTIKDTQYGYRVFEARKLPLNQSEAILTTPPLRLSSAAPNDLGVNLRWYLSNSYLRSLKKKGVDSDKVVFASLHADSLHPSVGGTMIYVPGERYRGRTYGFKGAAYQARKEVREQAYVSFTREQRQKSEGLSREFAAHLLRALKRRGAAIHPYQPVRDRIIRRTRPWVPAVLRCNQVSVQILLEVCNINNPRDARLLTDPAFRQKMADAFVDALLSYYA